MKRGFFLFHGLPGVGKTALCKQLAATMPNMFFANLAASPDFKKMPMRSICVSMYGGAPSGSSLITEGVLPTISSRDKLVNSVLSGIRASYDISFDVVGIVFIRESDWMFMSKRRNRSAEEYRRANETMQPGSADFEYIVYEPDDTERGNLDERTRRISSLLTARLAG